ncbi:MAG: P-loop NTPase [Fervidicoccaceae archaeon]
MSLEEDPRVYSISVRIREVSTIIPVMSYKGGVGKSTISALLSLALDEGGYKVGLLDLDFTNPSIHRIFGIDIETATLREEKGVLPLELGNIKVMSVAFFTKDNPLPLRGSELDSVFKELLSITIWGKLDFLVVDMPPGLSDIALDVLKYFREKMRPIIVSASSILSVAPTINLAKMMREIKLNPLGVIINRGVGTEEVYENVLRSIAERGISILGTVEKDGGLDASYGNTLRLRRTRAYSSVKKISESIEASIKKEIV